MEAMNKLIETVKEFGWHIQHECDGIYLLSILSPANQDFNIQVDSEGNEPDYFVNNLYESYSDFDVSYETYIWLDSSGHGTNGAPYDMKDLYEDMEWCQNAILELWRELYKIDWDYEDDEDSEDEVDEIEGRNAVIEAFRSGKPMDKVFMLDGCQDGPMMTIRREAKKHDVMIKYVSKDRLDQMSETGKHQGVIAVAAAYEYAEVEDILQAAKDKGEAPFIFLLDNIEDPHNLGAIIRTANLAGAHGVIIPKNRAVGLTATVARTSAGALNYTPVAKVTNMAKTIEELKKEGLWFVCADMGGTTMYQLDLKGPMGLVIGNEGDGVSRLVREKCDFIASIPMKGDIDSLNASVAAGVLAYEIVRQRLS